MTDMNNSSDRESKVRTQLEESAKSLAAGEPNRLLSASVRSVAPWAAFAMVIHWAPDQAEDFYWVLLDEKRIGLFEIPRGPLVSIDDVVVEFIEVSVYSKKLSQSYRRKLKVAIELMKARSAKAHG